MMMFLPIPNNFICLGFPFGKPRLCGVFDGVVGAAGGSLISGIGSIIGGNQSAKAAKYAANKQYEIAQATNQANKDIAESNNKWNYQMFLEQNEYNSAVNQRKRLEEAGLNPYLMMNGGSAGIAQSAPTADTSGTQVAPNIQEGLTQAGIAKGNAIAAAASQIGQMVYGQAMQSAQIDNVKAQTRKSAAEAAIAESNARFQDQINDVSLGNMRKQGLISDEEYNRLKLSNQFDSDTMEDRKLQIFLSTKLADEQLQSNKYQNEILKNEAFFANKKAQKEFDILCQEYLNAVAAGKLTMAQARTEVSKQALNYASADNQNSQAALAKSQKVAQDMTNDIFKDPQVKLARRNDIISGANIKTRTADNLKKQGALIDATSRKTSAEANLTRKRVDSYDTDKFFERTGMIVEGIDKGTKVVGEVKGMKNKVAKPGTFNRRRR